jgi:hypothetical protein
MNELQALLTGGYSYRIFIRGSEPTEWITGADSNSIQTCHDRERAALFVDPDVIDELPHTAQYDYELVTPWQAAGFLSAAQLRHRLQSEEDDDAVW